MDSLFSYFWDEIKGFLYWFASPAYRVVRKWKSRPTDNGRKSAYLASKPNSHKPPEMPMAAVSPEDTDSVLLEIPGWRLETADGGMLWQLRERGGRSNGRKRRVLYIGTVRQLSREEALQRAKIKAKPITAANEGAK